MTNTSNTSEGNKKHIESITIENIDTPLLENQRKLLNKVMHRLSKDSTITVTGTEHMALRGIEMMLDEWSDNEYHKNTNGG